MENRQEVVRDVRRANREAEKGKIREKYGNVYVAIAALESDPQLRCLSTECWQ